MSERSHTLQIGAPTAEEIDGGFALVFGHLTPSDRAAQVNMLIGSETAANTAAEGLLTARRDGQVVGAVFFQVQPGRTALVWPPRLADGEPETTACALLETACQRLQGKGVCLAMALLESPAGADEPLLGQVGFAPLADLSYMVSTEDHFPRSQPSGPLQLEPDSQVNHDRLVGVIEATYEQTLDCPRLNGVRRTEDVLAGYRATGVYSPENWLIVRHDRRDVGCLILADHPSHGNFELVYMGVMPRYRGKRWGVDITRFAQWRAARTGRQRLVLAVDAANVPAIDMYRSVGFQVWEQRRVLARAVR